MEDDLRQWVLDHNSDYAQVRDRIETVRNVVLHGRLEAAADIVEKSYMFAVLSIQTELERHERAFVSHYVGGASRYEAAQETVYGVQKSDWIDRTFESTDWGNLVLAIRYHVEHGNRAELLDEIDDNLVGVSHRKGAFMLAMAGLHEYACVDSNVARYTEHEVRDSYPNAESYLNDVDAITSNDLGLPTFVVQWAMYDYERGEHARHMTFYREVL